KLLPVTLRDVLEFRDDPPARLRLRKLEVDCLLLRRNLDTLNLVELLDPRLHLLSLSSLRPKAINERLQLLDALPLIAIRRRQLIPPLGFLQQVLIVVAAIKLHPLVPDLDRLA